MRLSFGHIAHIALSYRPCVFSHIALTLFSYRPCVFSHTGHIARSYRPWVLNHIAHIALSYRPCVFNHTAHIALSYRPCVLGRYGLFSGDNPQPRPETMFFNRVGSLFMPHNHHMAYPGDSRALMINVENRSKSATALVVRLIYLENAESENPEKKFCKKFYFF